MRIDPFTAYLPTLDLHGCDRVYSAYKVKEFIDENIKLRNKKIVIIHGIGLGIVKESVTSTLKKNKSVEKFYLDPNNIGQTIVYLKR